MQILQKERPTLAFHASITKPFGKGALISLLRQFAILHKDKKSISVGFIGYPNVGKSSVINTMKRKKVCNVAPIPGETKVWQFVSLTRKVFLIDCPGVVYSGQEHDETELILRGVCRVENIEEPANHIPEVLKRAEHSHIARLYQVTGWESDATGNEFLERMARARGKLLKGGEPDIQSIAKTVLRDWQYGKIPYLTQPDENYESKEKIKEKNKQETESDIKTREEITQKRKELEERIDINQDLDELTPKNLDDVENYGEEEEPEAAEAAEEQNESEDEEASTSNVSELDILKTKLAKARKVIKNGMLSRQDAVERAAARRKRMEESVDLTKIAKEAQKEEEAEAKKKQKLDEKFKDESDEEAKPLKEGTSKERRAKDRKSAQSKGDNYYTKANVKNKNRDKTVVEDLKNKFKKNKKTGVR